MQKKIYTNFWSLIDSMDNSLANDVVLFQSKNDINMSTVPLKTIYLEKNELLVDLDDKDIIETIEEIYYYADNRSYLLGKLKNGKYILIIRTWVGIKIFRYSNFWILLNTMTWYTCKRVIEFQS